jgi:glycosyltransferase involved in cell wall biosynthesis
MTSCIQSRQTPISVCLAAYNGSAFLRDQVASILPQLGAADELIAVDDASSDDSVGILNSFRDPRIRIFRHTTNHGVIATFEHALSEAAGDIIFISDQDDVWREDKVERIQGRFSLCPDVSLVLSDVAVIDAAGRVTADSWIGSKRFRTSMLCNLMRNRYLGCTMAFRRHLLDLVLPIPDDTPMHDMWIGMVNEIFGKTEFIHEPLVFYRRHGKNVTTGKHAPVAQMLRWRIALAKNLARLYWQFGRHRNSSRPAPQQG